MFGENIRLFFDFELKTVEEELIFSVGVLKDDPHSIICMWEKSNDNINKMSFTNLKKGNYRLLVDFKSPNLVPGTYFPNIAIRRANSLELEFKIRRFPPFNIEGNILPDGITKTKTEWNIEKLK